MTGSDDSVGVIDQAEAGQSNTKEVRTRQVRLMLDDGTLVTTYLQVVAIADDGGQPVDLASLSVLYEIRDLLREMLEHQQLHG